MTETEQLADVIALSIHAALEPLRRDIAALKSLAAIPGPAGRDGQDGRDADQETITQQVNQAMQKAIALLPAPKDGHDGLNGKDGATGPIGPMGPAGDRGVMGEVGQRGPMGEKGADGLNGKDGATGLAGKDGRDAVLDPALLTSLADRLESVEIKADLAQRIERDVLTLKSQLLQIKSLDTRDEIPADKIGTVLAEILTTELAALTASPWLS